MPALCQRSFFPAASAREVHPMARKNRWHRRDELSCCEPWATKNKIERDSMRDETQSHRIPPYQMKSSSKLGQTWIVVSALLLAVSLLYCAVQGQAPALRLAVVSLAWLAWLAWLPAHRKPSLDIGRCAYVSSREVRIASRKVKQGFTFCLALPCVFRCDGII